MSTQRIAVIGDLDASNRSHVATSEAIAHCSRAVGIKAACVWVGTDEIATPAGAERLREFEGLWIAPGSPYRNLDGALLAIRAAREQAIPVLGTCGGFQHIILEYARNVLGLADAEHEETHPHGSRLFISRLACTLAGRTMSIVMEPDSVIARAYGRTSAQEQYYCNFGVNPDYVETLRSGPLRIVASDAEGVVRAVELAGHPFFVGTLFLPQHNSSPAAPHPLIQAFIRACLRKKLSESAPAGAPV